jgi:hypothetical protein
VLKLPGNQMKTLVAYLKMVDCYWNDSEVAEYFEAALLDS